MEWDYFKMYPLHKVMHDMQKLLGEDFRLTAGLHRSSSAASLYIFTGYSAI